MASHDDYIVAKDVLPEKVEFLWRDRIPKGMLTVVAGRPDQGKGLFAAHVAAEVSRAGHKVIYSAAEDSHGLMTRPRLEAAGADLDNILLWRFRIPADFQMLTQLIEFNKAALVVMDPLAAHLSGGISRHSDNIREVLNPLTKAIEKTGTAVLIIEHALKRVPASGHVLNAIGGSGSGIVAAARAAYVFGVDPSDDERRILAKAKFNIGPEPKALAFSVEAEDLDVVGDIPLLEYEEELTDFDPMKLFEGKAKNAEGGRTAERKADAAEWLITYLVENGAQKAGMVHEDAKQHGLSQRTLRRAADDIEVVRTPPGGGRNCVWDLPDTIKGLYGLPTSGGPQKMFTNAQGKYDDTTGYPPFSEGGVETASVPNNQAVTDNEGYPLVKPDDEVSPDLDAAIADEFGQLLGGGGDDA